LGDPAIEITNLDALTYAGNPDNLAGIDTDPRYLFVRGDIADRPLVMKLLAEGKFNAIVNFAAESHVDRSINDAMPFLRTNVQGTVNVLQMCRAGPRLLRQLDDGLQHAPAWRSVCEATRYANSPYAASAPADLVRCCTHVLTRHRHLAPNNYGPTSSSRSHPAVRTNTADIPVRYGDAGSALRHVDHCRGVTRPAPRQTRRGPQPGARGTVQHRRTTLLEPRRRSLIRHVTDRLATTAATPSMRQGWRPLASPDRLPSRLASTVACGPRPTPTGPSRPPGACPLLVIGQVTVVLLPCSPQHPERRQTSNTRVIIEKGPIMRLLVTGFPGSWAASGRALD
jgi:dTDP-glucose 4,6-dehydratase